MLRWYSIWMSLFFLLPVAVDGQQKANYKLADKYSVANAGSLLYSRAVKANYIPDSDCFWFSYKTSRGGEILPRGSAEGKTRALVRPREDGGTDQRVDPQAVQRPGLEYHPVFW